MYFASRRSFETIQLRQTETVAISVQSQRYFDSAECFRFPLRNSIELAGMTITNQHQHSGTVLGRVATCDRPDDVGARPG